MTTSFPSLTVSDQAGPRGENLESCVPLLWPGREHLSEHFVKSLATRLLAASFREPHLLSTFAFRKTCLIKLLVFAREAFAREHNIVDVVVPHNGHVHVLGDTHGDYHSLLTAISQTGLPSSQNFLCFAGDCVDRGSWGVEVFVFILLLKVWKPSSVFLIRGNHETTGCVFRYGFANEVRRKYDTRVLDTFFRVFRDLPCAVIIRTLPTDPLAISSPGCSDTECTKGKTLAKKKHQSTTRTKSTYGRRATKNTENEKGWSTPCHPGERRVLVVHGGLFRRWKNSKKPTMELGTLSDLSETPRFVDDPMNSILEDVIWSDPQNCRNDVCLNKYRGAGILFGPGAVQAFLKKNRLHGIIRAHEGPDMREKRPDMNSMETGYSVDMQVASGFLATVFSASKYPPDEPRQNLGAFATFQGKGLGRIEEFPKFTPFEKTEYPKEFTLFYQPEADDKSATPRHSLS